MQAEEAEDAESELSFSRQPLTEQLTFLGRYARLRQQQDLPNLRQLVARELFLTFASRAAELSRPLSKLQQDVHPTFTLDSSGKLEIDCAEVKARDKGTANLFPSVSQIPP